MRARAWWLAALALSAAGTMAWGQMQGACGPFSVGAMVYGAPGKTGAPYSAVVKTTFEQKLVDGNAIHGSTTTHQARDSAGRTMSEMAQGCMVDADGQNKPLVRVTVYDPAIKGTLTWNVNDQSPKVIRLFHYRQPEPAASATPAEMARMQQARQMQQRQWQSEHHTENLGTRNIAGVMAVGSRVVVTIPAGEEGNEKPIESVDEVWVAKDLGLAMLKITDDPRSGRTTTEVRELNQTEPDAASFAPPAGYRIEEQVVKTVSTGGAQ